MILWWYDQLFDRCFTFLRHITMAGGDEDDDDDDDDDDDNVDGRILINYDILSALGL